MSAHDRFKRRNRPNRRQIVAIVCGVFFLLVTTCSGLAWYTMWAGS